MVLHGPRSSICCWPRWSPSARIASLADTACVVAGTRERDQSLLTGRQGAGMSSLDLCPQEMACGGRAAIEPVRDVLDGSPVALGAPRGMTVTRTLPNRRRRMVRAWFFIDHYGPDDISDAPGMQVAGAAHPFDNRCLTRSNPPMIHHRTFR